jgi:flagellar protein FliT
MDRHLKIVDQPKYKGQAGVLAMRSLQQALNLALQNEDWGRVRHLDRICVLLIDRVIAANKEDRSTLVCALGELKGVYAGLIAQCQQQVSLMANH